jgi:hypothetical protein
MIELIIVIFSAVVLVLAVRGALGKNGKSGNNDNTGLWADSGDGDGD